MMIWKIVGVLKVSVLYIYIDKTAQEVGQKGKNVKYARAYLEEGEEAE